MKRIITLIFLTVFITTAGWAAYHNDLSGPISIKGTLNAEYEDYPAGTPVTIRRITKIEGNVQHDGIYYAVDIQGVQFGIPVEESKIIQLDPPENNQEFWQHVYLKNKLFQYFKKNGYREKLRTEIDEECKDYLYKVNDIAYKDDYITSYVQSIFAKLTATGHDLNRKERLNIRVIQSPNPDAYMLPNGSLLISTGLLCTLDSDDELAGIIASEMAHFVLDHQIDNIYRAERRAKRAAFWADILQTTADAALDIAYWNNNDKALAIGTAATIGTIGAVLNMDIVNRLGMQYKLKQEILADRIACEFLTFNKFNPDGLSSALHKIALYYYNSKFNSKELIRYGSLEELRTRYSKLGIVDVPSNRNYLKSTQDIITFNATMNLADERYEEASRLIEKSIQHNLATDNDYVILVKAQMALYNTQEVNEECMTMLWKAQELAGDNPNLDIYKQEILLFLRMNKQAKAAEKLKVYMDLLSAYESQKIEGEELAWTMKEKDWANQLLNKINRF